MRPGIEIQPPSVSEACGRVEADGLTGTGYLTGPAEVVTAAQVITHAARVADGPSIQVTFAGHSPRQAEVKHIDDATDVAVLSLSHPIAGVEPFGLAAPTVGPCSFRFDINAIGDADSGVILDVDVADLYGDPRMTLHSPGLAAQMLPARQPFAGTPVLVDGEVVGHLTSPVRDPNDMTESFFDLVSAASARSIAEVLRRTPLAGGDTARDPSPLLTPPEIGRKENHAFVSYRAIEDRSGNDEDFAKPLGEQLGKDGFRCYLAPHFLFGTNPLAAEYAKELQRSRVALLLFSRHWAREPAFDHHIEVILEHAGEESSGLEVVVVRLDDTELPASLTPLRTIDVSADRMELDKRRPPNAEAIRKIALALGASRRSGEAGEEAQVSRGEIATETLQGIEDQVLTELTRLRKYGKKQRSPNPKTIRALGDRWLDVGLAGSDVPVEAARLMIGWLEYEGALELLDRAEHALGSTGSDRDLRRVRRMRGICLAELGNVDDAIELLESVKRKGPLDAWAGGILGGMYKRKGKHLGRELLLLSAYQIYRDTYGRTLHYYPGINAATLGKMLGETEEATAIATQIRSELEGSDDLYHWDEATLGEAYLLLGEYDLALKAYSNAALQVVTDRKAMVSMRRQFPLILGDNPTDPEAQEARTKLDSLFNIGHVAAFSGHLDPALADDPNDYQVRKLRHEIEQSLSEKDIAFGFCAGGDDLSDLIFAECVLARSGRVEIVLPYLQSAFVNEISTPVRALFDKVTAHERVNVSVLHDFVPEDRRAARASCSAAVLDRALEEARLLEQEPIFILAVDESVPPPKGGEEGDALSPTEIEAVAVAEARAAGYMASAVGLEKIEISPRLSTEPPPLPDEEESRSGAPAVRDDVRATSFGAAPGSGPTPPGEYRKRHLMVVGIDAYSGGWKPLRNAKNDAKGFMKSMVDNFGFEVSAALFDDKADKRSIAVAFQEGLNRGKGASGVVEPDDLVVFFFAGHGHTERRLNDEEQGYLVPFGVPEGEVVDLLPFTELREWTIDLPARHALFILDSCFSGIAAVGGGGGGPKQDFARRVITAGAMQQVVSDGGPWPGHSIFTGRLLHGLEDETEIARPIDDNKLVTYLVEHVQNDTREANRPFQRPSHGTLPRHGGDTIVLTVPPSSS